MKSTMGIDQYGTTYHDLGEYPRRELLRRLGRSKASKMYRDSKVTGEVRHVGYAVGRLWVELFTVSQWEGGKGVAR